VAGDPARQAYDGSSPPAVPTCGQVRGYLAALAAGQIPSPQRGVWDSLSPRNALAGSFERPELTAVGEQVLRELELRAYRVDSRPLDEVAAEVGRSIAQLGETAEATEYFVAELGPVPPVSVLPLLRIVAADLASMGWTAAPDILEAPLGFFQVGGGFDPKIIVDRLGNPWMFAKPGDLIKRFPCGTIQQQVMDEMLRLIQKNGIQAADVEKVEVGGNLSNYRTLFQHHPTTGLQGKFSMEYAMAILLLDRKATLSSFTDAVAQRADVQDMIRRVHYAVDPEFNKLELQGASLQAILVEQSGLKIYMKDGRVISGVTQPAKGSPENPMTYEEVADKFRGNAEFAKWPKEKAESVIEQVKSLETAPDMSRLTAALAG
jgi:hypothetical protein